MSKTLAKLAKDGAVFLTARCAASMLQMLPWRRGRELAGWCGEMFYLLDRPERKQRAAENLRRAFPGMTPAESCTLLRRVYSHAAQGLLDALHFTRLVGRRPDADLFEFEGFERLAHLPEKPGIVFATAHFGSWEVAGTALPCGGFPIWSMMRGFRNVFADTYIRNVRRSTGAKMLEKHGALRHIIRLLRRGEHVALLIDQDARRHGIFVQFFGRPASTTPAPASLALRTGAPVAFGYARRIGPERFRVVLDDVIQPNPDADTDQEVLRITQRLTSDLERLVRESPADWLWMHRRWKTTPAARAARRKSISVPPST
jgi:Kdo2-lipid IVA lauroyltransferase/acyltransferase